MKAGTLLILQKKRIIKKQLYAGKLHNLGEADKFSERY